ncbi:Hypothetical predicted protein [Mytilus galloprovincialis]|uniref:OTU domain-containing protein n=1 Tax=Mytilus galloprovincialis TaxID=29158 RepID=A0A8B6GHE6_MYTGA|nr:Hypothetical predicted protein [Mytilus galloprovincialis]
MNPDVFEDTDFAPSYVTDRPMQTSSDDLTQREQMSDESPPAVPNKADEQHEGEKSNEEQDKTDNNQEQRSDPNEESNLQNYLQERQRVLVNVRGDGHCLVYAFQICMDAELNEKIGTEEIFQNLRVEANRNKNFYKDFITDDQDLITEVNSYMDENNYMSGTADPGAVMQRVSIENNNISQLTQLPTTSSADRERNLYLVLTGQHAAAHYSATVRETAAGHQDHQKKTATSFDPSEVRPFPKAPPLKNPRKTSSRKRKTAILTDTPEKNALEEEEKRKCQKQQKTVKRKLPLQKRTRRTNKQKQMRKSNNSDDEDECFCLYLAPTYGTSNPAYGEGCDMRRPLLKSQL